MTENDSFGKWQDKCYKPTIQKFPERKPEFTPPLGYPNTRNC